jgi:hypothetical protein
MINLAMALRVEAMRLARNAVRARMRAQGIKVNYVSTAEITAAAKAWLRDHPELAHQAFRTIFAEQLRHLLRRAKFESDAQKSRAAKSMVSPVQISSAKVEPVS